ncbi:epiplakin [Narcine bancroftii]|uniref:epiplakin n=1 Tax=Narcine bancroftii TaxID=1343680 RepID=UPI0038318124
MENGKSPCKMMKPDSSMTKVNLGKESVQSPTTGTDPTGSLSQHCGSIAGLLIHSTNVKMSIYQALKKRLLPSGVALLLLEAQAATGTLIDPMTEEKMSVTEALQAGVIGPDVYDKLLSAEKALTGYRDPSTGDIISLFQAMKKELVVSSHGIRLLEAQLATGGIIDPVSGHQIPVAVAYQRGMFDQELNKTLSDPSDDSKGFFDPNTQENLSYMELMQRCVTEPSSGLCLLLITDKVVKGVQITTDEQTRIAFKKTLVSVKSGRFRGRRVTLWEVINSEYFTEDQISEFLKDFKSGKTTMEKITNIVCTIIEKIEREQKVAMFRGLRHKVSAQQLLDSKIIDQNLYQKLEQGFTSAKELTELQSVKQYLTGTCSIAGVLVESTNETMSIYQAMKRHLLMPGTALVLLEAQAATGFVIDPVKNAKLTVDEAVDCGLVGSELRTKLLSAEQAVTGYKDPYTGQKISLFQALKKDLILKDHGIRLLEAQIATGGIIDPVQSHRLPVDVAYKRGMFDEEMNKILSDAGDDTKGFFDPNTRENLTYLQLKERCVTDPATGLCFLCLRNLNYINKETEIIFKQTRFSITKGKFAGKNLTIWEFLNSEYVMDRKRREIIQQYRSGRLTIQQIITSFTKIIEDIESKSSSSITVDGFRKKVSIQELMNSQVIGRDEFEDLQDGRMTLQGLLQMDSVKRYIEGYSSIAGVLVESTNETISIYQAMKRHLLMPGTALVLLEAQAATGFVIDPVKNAKLTVDEAVDRGLVGSELRTKLLSAEQAVTGYKDPYTGHKISLFQALKKDLILKDHGIRLLEAQIATGGIIDPVHSHRLPVDVAYKRGMFDEEMNKVLSDAGDDTKGFLDPNTRENLTYLQLKERCATDPATALCLLKISKGIGKKQQGYSIGEIESAFQREIVCLSCGKFKGKFVTLWEIIHSEYFSEEQRKKLMEMYRCKEVDMKTIISRITTIIEESEIQAISCSVSSALPSQCSLAYSDQETEAAFRKTTVSFSVWCLLHSKLFTEEERRTLIESYRRKEIDMESVIRTVNGMIEQRQCLVDTSIIFCGLRSEITLDELVDSKIIDQKTVVELQEGTKTVQEVSELDSVKIYLKGSDSIAGVLVESTNETMSIYQAMKRHLLMPGTALVLLEAQAATGFVIDPVKNAKLTVDEAVDRGLVGSELRTKLLSAEQAVTGYKDPYTGQKISLFQALKKDLILKDHGIRLLEAQIATGGIIDPVHSHRLPVDVAYKRGMFDEEMNKVLSDAGDDTKGFLDPNTRENLTYLQLKERCGTDPATGLCLLKISKGIGKKQQGYSTGEIESAFQREIVCLSCGKFKGRFVTLWEIIHSEYFSEEQRKKLMEMYRCKEVDMKTIISRITTIIEESEIQAISCSVSSALPSQCSLAYSDQEAEAAFRKTTVSFSVWCLLHSKLFTEEERRTLIESYRRKEIDMESVIRTVNGIIEQRQCLVDTSITFCGLRSEITLDELVDSKIIDQKTVVELQEGTKTVQEVSELDSVKIYLKGSDSIAGVLVESTNETMSIYQAMKRHLLMPGTALVLLEAQAATGFVIDPVKNAKLTVDEAVDHGLVGSELRTKLLSAEQAVTGYKDPYTGHKISLFQALKKDLILKDHGIRLLEAQIATGGIIDPVHSHRLPVDVAYKRGMFDEEMNKVLSDAGDDTKGFLDPNTRENLTYLQLKERCGTDPATGLCLLKISKGIGKKQQGYSTGEIESAFQREIVCLSCGKFKGRFVTLWEIIHSENFSEEQRKKLMEMYRCKEVDMKTIISRITTIIEESEIQAISCNVSSALPSQCSLAYSDQETEAAFRKTTVSFSVWCLLHSKLFTEEERRTLIESYRRKEIDMESVIRTVNGIIEQRQCLVDTSITFCGLRSEITLDELVDSKIIDQKTVVELQEGTKTVQEVSELDSVKIYLKGSDSIAGVLVESTNETMSIYQAMKRHLLMPGTALVLLEAQAATGFVIDPVKNAKLTVDEAVDRELVGSELRTKLLSAEQAVTGYKDPYTGQKISLFQALKKDLILKDHGIRLLEAQIATGGIIDPVHSHRLPVDVAYKRGMFDEEMNKVLSDAGDDTKGFLDPNTRENLTYLQLKERCGTDPATGLCLLKISKGIGKKQQGYSIGEIESAFQREIVCLSCGKFKGRFVTLWEIIHSEYFSEEQRKKLMEMYRCKEVDMKTIISRITTIIEESEIQAISCSVSSALPSQCSLAYSDQEAEAAFRKTTVSFSVWCLLHSKLFTEEERRTLIESYRRKEIDMESVIRTVNGIIEQRQCLVDTSITFCGLRSEITLDELVDSKIIDQKTVVELQEGTKTVQEVSELDSVKIYLKGSDSIAGVLVESTNETMSIYKAMKRHLLMPGTALVLLEAQAATGFVIDPVKNAKLTVDEAVDHGLVGSELRTKLLSAEQAVTGYKDPYTGHKISLFQALKKDLILKDHGIRLLEAQIATGGIIDPVHSHRLPVDVAYKRGMFDEEMNKVLSDAGDDTKGFLDPNTRENLTYLQLKERCGTDPATGLCLLKISKGIGKKQQGYSTGEIESAFQREIVCLSCGKFKGRFVTLWEIIHSENFSEEQRKKLMEMYRCKEVDMKTIISRITTIIEESEIQAISCSVSSALPSQCSLAYSDQETEAAFRKTTVSFSVWCLLHSKLFTEEERKTLIESYRRKEIDMESVIRTVNGMIEQRQCLVDTSITFCGLRSEITLDELVDSKIIDQKTVVELQEGTKTVQEVSELDSVKIYLKGSDSIAGVMVESTNETMSIYQAMKRHLLMPGTALVLLEAQAATGFVIDPVKNAKLTVDEAVDRGLVGSELRTKLLSAEQAVTGYKDPYTGQKISLFQALKKDLILKDHGIRLLEAQIATGGIIDPVHSHRLPVDVAYKRGMFDEEMNNVLSDAGDDTKGFLDPNTRENLTYLQLKERCGTDPATGLCLLKISKGIRKKQQGYSIGEIESAFQREIVCLSCGKFKGSFVTLWEIIHSEYFSEEQRKKLMEMYRCKEVDMKTIISRITTIIEESEILAISCSVSSALPSQCSLAYSDQEAEAAFRKTTVSFSVWCLLHSKLFTEEERRTLIESYRRKEIDMESVIRTVNGIIEQRQCLVDTSITFCGLRSEITLDELVDSKIIDQKTVVELQEGTKTVQEVSELDSVKIYLKGSDSIAGVLVESTNETMSIYQAMKRHLLMPGTALVLLEAQAATGFVIDPVKNAKLTVDEAVDHGLVGSELRTKLLSAEQAVTGYKDPYTGHKISLFQALKKDLILKDHGIRLLEAQIATGGIIDPVHSHRLPVDVAYKRGMFDEEMNKVLSDAGDDTKGFLDPNTRENLTYLQLKERCGTDPATGLCLLKISKVIGKKQQGYSIGEIESAFQREIVCLSCGKFKGKFVTLWEIIHSEYFSEEQRKELMEMYRCKEVDMKTIISRITTIIEESEIQAISCSVSSALPSQCSLAYSDQEAEAAFRKTTVSFSVWCLLHSKLFTEEERRTLIESYRRKEIDMESVIRTVNGIIEQRQCLVDTSITFCGLRSEITLDELVDSKIIDQKTVVELQEGTKTVQEVSELDSVKIYLKGSDSIAGVLVESTNETMSIYKAMKRHLLMPGTALVLLEAQAATGFVIDPVKNAKLTVDEAVDHGLVGSELRTKLLSAEQAVTGYKDPYTGHKISLFQALKKDLILKDHGIRLLEAQIATGGIIDPVHSHRLPVDVAYKRGMFDEEMNKVLSDAGDDTKGFLDPNTRENLTYLQLKERCGTDPATGLCLLKISKGIGKKQQGYSTGEIESAFQREIVCLSCGKFKGRFVTLWEIIHSENFSEEQRKKLMEMYRCKEVDMKTIISRITTIIEESEIQAISCSVSSALPSQCSLAYSDQETEAAFRKTTVSFSVWCLLHSKLFTEEERKTLIESYRRKEIDMESVIRTVNGMIEQRQCLVDTSITFCGLRSEITLDELVDSKIIDQKTVVELQEGTKTVQEVSELDSVKIYLKGSDSIAGVMVESTNETMSIYQAMKRHLLMPGTALVLLEAQAATGFVIDPVKNAKLTVDEAVDRGLVGSELRTKLLSAEQAVTGYKDPYTGQKISLFQALKKDLILKDHGIRLLEAQIATGGIIDPVHSHRLPVDVAYKRGMFDEEMNNVLSDAGDDTKGFLDPNTRENLTYLQLKERCGTDPATGLCLLKISKGIRKKQQGYSIGEIESAFQREIVCLSCGKFKGSFVTLWEIIHSEYFSEEQRKKLMEMYRCKEVDMKTIISRITTIIEESEILAISCSVSSALPSQCSLAYSDQEAEAAFRKTTVSFSVWCLLHSKLFTEEERRTLIESYRRKEIDMESVIRTVNGIIEQRQCLVDTSITFCGLRSEITLDELVDSKIIDQKTVVELQEGTKTVQEVSELDSVKIYLKGSDSIAGVLVESTNETMSIYQAMKRHLLMPGTALVLLEAQAATGFVIDPVKNAKLTVDEAVDHGLVGSELRTKLLSAEQAVTGYKDPYTGHKISLFQALKKDLILKDHGIRLLEAQIATGGIIDPVHSHRLPVDVAYKRGMFDEEMNKVLSDAGDDTKGFLDPNTRENLTYLQLKERCGTDPATGLCLLKISKVIGKKQQGYSIGEIESAFQREIVCLSCGKFKGKFVTLWEIIHSEYFSEEQRKELMEMYRCKEVDMKTIISRITTIIEESEIQAISCSVSSALPSQCSLAYSDQETEAAFRKTTVSFSVWCLLHSKLFTEEERRTLIESYRRKEIDMESVIRTVNGMIEQRQCLVDTSITFCGLRSEITLDELVDSKIIDQKTVVELQEGTKTVQEVSELDSVKIYLKGSDSIAGVLVESTNETMSIYQAMKRHLLMPGTALVLLEAQAATGFVIDPVKNAKLTVDEAVDRGLVGSELRTKLLSAEQAVTGYKNPYTGHKISLFQALKKDLILKDHGIRLLEAQIATGGIIDPVHSHRLPVDVAYKRGMFDEEMNKVLSDAGDDTKGFFEPNTRENLTYLQLKEKCVKCPKTGLCLLFLKR